VLAIASAANPAIIVNPDFFMLSPITDVVVFLLAKPALQRGTSPTIELRLLEPDQGRWGGEVLFG
jgi:hypothetical protein